MSYSSSIISLIFLSCLAHSFYVHKKGFRAKWNLLQKYFLILMPAVLLFWDIHIWVRLVLFVMVIIKLLVFSFQLKPKVLLLLNIINILAIIAVVNLLPSGISPESYVGISICFGAFFILVFDSLLIFREKVLTRTLFLIFGYLFMFQTVWSVFELKL